MLTTIMAITQNYKYFKKYFKHIPTLVRLPKNCYAVFNVVYKLINHPHTFPFHHLFSEEILSCEVEKAKGKNLVSSCRYAKHCLLETLFDFELLRTNFKMAKFVIAGVSNCPFYARAELIGDALKLRLPDFSIHKIVLNPEDWGTWIEKTICENGWQLSSKACPSPVIWRELVNRGGKGVFIGSCDEFLEISKIYYGIDCTKSTNELKSIANENMETKIALQNLQQEETQRRLTMPLFRMVIVFSDSIKDLIYSLLLNLLLSPLSSKNEKLEFIICSEDIELNKALVNELQDCAFTDLHSIKSEIDVSLAVNNSDYIIILSPNTLDKVHLDMLKSYGIALNSVKNTAKIIVAGSNAMQSCFVISHFANIVSKKNFFALSRFEENKLKSVVAKKLNVNSSKVNDIFLWGSENQFIIDLTIANVHGYDGAIWAPHLTNFTYPVEKVIYERKWVEETVTDYINSKQQKVTPLSFSVALVTQVKDTIDPMCKKMFSMGVVSEGWYGIPENLVFSVPVFYKDGYLTVKDNLQYSKNFENKIQVSAAVFKQHCDHLIDLANA